MKHTHHKSRKSHAKFGGKSPGPTYNRRFSRNVLKMQRKAR